MCYVAHPAHTVRVARMVGSCRYPSIKSFDIMLSSIVVQGWKPSNTCRCPSEIRSKRQREQDMKHKRNERAVFFVSLGPSYSVQHGGGAALFIHARRLFVG